MYKFRKFGLFEDIFFFAHIHVFYVVVLNWRFWYSTEVV